MFIHKADTVVVVVVVVVHILVVVVVVASVFHLFLCVNNAWVGVVCNILNSPVLTRV